MNKLDALVRNKYCKDRATGRMDHRHPHRAPPTRQKIARAPTNLNTRVSRLLELGDASAKIFYRTGIDISKPSTLSCASFQVVAPSVLTLSSPLLGATVHRILNSMRVSHLISILAPAMSVKHDN
jgi:hypothetical protein